MTASLSILAAALDRVQLDPAACSLPPRAQAERAAFLVMAKAGDVADGQTPASRSPLLVYVEELQRAKEGLRQVLAAMEPEGEPSAPANDVLMANFERALDIYYQATSNVAELVRRMVQLPSERIVVSEFDDQWHQE